MSFTVYDIYVGAETGPFPGNEGYENIVCVNENNDIIRCDDMAPILYQGKLVNFETYNIFPYVMLRYTYMFYDIYAFDCTRFML